MSLAAFRFRRGWGGAAVSLGVSEGTREATGPRVFSGGAFSAGNSASTVDPGLLGSSTVVYVFGGIIPSGQGRRPHGRQDQLTPGVTPWRLRGRGFVRTQGPPGRPERGRGWAAFSPELLQAPSLPGLQPTCPLGRGHWRGGPPRGLKVRLPAASFRPAPREGGPSLSPTLASTAHLPVSQRVLRKRRP